MTFAPRTFPSCSEATPTPDETPLISSHSPALSRPCSTSMSYDTRNVIGMLAASSHDRAGGAAIASACFHQRVFRKRSAAPAHHAIARLEAGDFRPDGDDLAGTFAADRLPGAGLAVQAMAEHELAAVERRGVHAHQQLRRSRLGHRRLAQIEHGFRVGHLHPVGLHRCLPNP